MKLSVRQGKVLANTLAWTNELPTEEDIEELFNWIDRGIKGKSAFLYQAWVAHYGDEFAWIGSYDKGTLRNPPVSPPAAWIYDSQGWNGDLNHWNGWIGWLNILIDCLRDWPKRRPMFERAYLLHVYFKGLVPLNQFYKLLQQQKR